MKELFWIGQRVRLKQASTQEAIPRGAIGTITEPQHWALGWHSQKPIFGYSVALDAYPHPEPEKYSGWLVQEKYLEPIYDGDQASSWSECAWRPREIERV